MNAPASIPQQSPARETQPAWAKYLPSVEAFCPGGDPEAKRHRAGLLLLRDMASSARRHASWESGEALLAIERVAGEHAFSTMTAEELDATRLALIRVYTGARDLDRVFGRSPDGR